jgi:hypothetical protein
MSVQNFLTKDNIQTLWDVVIDENIFKFLEKEHQINVLNIFNENLKGFFETEKTKAINLVYLNKKYIMLILNYITKNFKSNIPNKIKIYDEPETKEPITYEEIQNEKKTQFEMDLMKRQQDFTNAITMQVPDVPDFKDNFKDEPISEMEKMIKEITKKRNYDVEQINQSYQKENEQWMKPQETSIKSEKFLSQNQNQNKIQENVEDHKKNVTWGNNEIINKSLENVEEQDIFKKLKKVNTNENITLTLNDNSFEQRLTNIEEKLEMYNYKIDKVLQLLQR